ncbi:hypothetical protein ABMA28_011941 [Loxostege sticticalis]|uniref:Uncharacterized protein n=1 Tax=Loxostege sticticalis TaxID=481309 RepID=A0ABD0TL06_LOXSC
MRVAFLVLLSLLAFTNAGPAIQNNLEFGDELSLEDNVVGFYNTLEYQQRSLIAETIRNTLEGFRDVVINGNDVVPVLDPFVIDHIGPFLYTNTGVRGEGNVRNLRVEGLKWYLVDRVNFNAFRLTLGVQITVPWIITTADYDARASVAFFTHNAGGNIRVFVNRLVVSVDLRLGTNIFGGSLFLRQLDIKLDIHDTHIQLTGMFGSSLVNNFISSMVQSVTQEVIQSQLETVSQTVSEQLFDVINEFLKDFTIADISG